MNTYNQHAHPISIQNLRQRSLSYILKYFDMVSRSQSFEEMGRKNIDLGDNRY